ncbi:MAG: hypothetical protein RLY93_00305 [Sumerlaeia bacterium]
MKPLDQKLINRLRKMGALDGEQSDLVTRRTEESGLPAQTVLDALGIVEPKIVARQVARLSGLEFLDLDAFEPAPEVLRQLPTELVQRYAVLPVGEVGGDLILAVSDATNVLKIDELKALTGRTLRVVLATEKSIRRALALYYSVTPAEEALSSRRSRTPQPEFRSEERELTTRGRDIHEVATVFDATPAPAPGKAAGPERPPEAPEAPQAGTSASESSSDSETEDISFHDLETRIDMGSKETRLDMPGSLPPDAIPVAGSANSASTELLSVGDAQTFLDPAAQSTRIASPEKTSHKNGWIRLAIENDSDLEVLKTVEKVLEEALEFGAEEIELAPPTGPDVIVRARKATSWIDLHSYNPRLHEPVVAHLRKMSGLPAAERESHDLLIERRFDLSTRRGEVPVVAHFATTVRGSRCLLRLPENTPLLQRPLRILGTDNDLQKRIGERLDSGAGGAIFFSATTQRMAAQLFSSLLHEQASRGRSVIALEMGESRTIPNVSQISCEDAPALLDNLHHASKENPDVLGVSSIPDVKTMREVLNLALQGQTIVGAFSAPDASSGMAIYEAAGLDPLELFRGIVAHIHASQVPRLCSRCRAEMEDPAGVFVSPWAEAFKDLPLYEAKGCPDCRNTGRKGSNWVAEAFVPRSEPEGERFRQVRHRETALRQLVREAWLDPRDIRS